ncbi:PREDICTED: uncharacterized protein LOC108360517 [Rhagoletis zephyria]|uniref:uncharacterized protein LOC108360517 n=1 Tax=Rhagoletis zephyria TaxID=28612 RepID=UPI0008116FBE|nr:PREDICTED: uncharacterized protein LOC108360517 [Rhagoletis zephyria]
MLYLNFLGLNHTSKECLSSRRCQVCHVSHHTLLHRSHPTTPSSPQSSAQVQPPSSSLQSSTALQSSSKPTVLQKTKLGWVVAGTVTNHSHLSSAALVSSYTTSVSTDCLLSTTKMSQLTFNSSQQKTESPSLEPSCDDIL